MEGRRADKFSARLSQIAKEYLSPPPTLHFVAYEDEQQGDWGAIVVPPSPDQPHIFIKELSGNPARHEWFVRINDTTERASIADYSRILASATRRAIAPLDLELQTIRRDLTARGEQHTPLLLDALRSLAGGTRADVPSPTDLSPAARVKLALSTPTSAMEDALVGEALHLRKVMVEDRPENPQRFPQTTADELQKPLAFMEDQAKSFCEMIANVLRYDRDGRLSDALVEAFAVLAEEPTLSGSHWQHASELRLYPLVLAMGALAFCCVARNDGRLLRRVLDLQLRSWNNGVDRPLIYALLSLRTAKDLFNGARGKQQPLYEPIAERMLALVPAWCSSAGPSRRGQDVFFEAEFVLALEHTTLTTLSGRGIPFTGRFAYSNDSTRVLERFLGSRPKVLDELFGQAIEARLGDFDTNMQRVVEGGFRRGFVDGALAAWKKDVEQGR